MTRVVHIRDVPPGWERTDDPSAEYVYIGRPGRFGNPYRTKRLASGFPPRGSSLEHYRRWLWLQLHHRPDYREEVKALYGKNLVCYCKPNPCHGDILARAANWLNRKGSVAG